MLVFITIHNEGFSQVKETKITALFDTSTYQQSFERKYTPGELMSSKFLSSPFEPYLYYHYLSTKAYMSPKDKVQKHIIC